ncbi:MAG: hypothetical protein QXZ17_02700, partial [Nitrososphaerota archaeon]
IFCMPSAPKLKPRLRVALYGYPKNTLENTELINLPHHPRPKERGFQNCKPKVEGENGKPWA